MSFLKENLYNSVKLFLNQIGLTVFGTMLALAFSKNDKLLLASSIFSILFYLSLCYITCWDIGAKDKIRIDGGRLNYKASKGLLLSFFANIPNIVLSALMGIGILINTEASINMCYVCNAIARLLNGMYLGTIKVLQETLNATITEVWWWFGAIAIPSMLVCTAAYILGAKNFRIASLFGFGQTDKKQGKK